MEIRGNARKPSWQIYLGTRSNNPFFRTWNSRWSYVVNSPFGRTVNILLDSWGQILDFWSWNFFSTEISRNAWKRSFKMYFKDTPYYLEKLNPRSWKRRVVPAQKWQMWHFGAIVWDLKNDFFGGGYTNFSAESGLSRAAKSWILETRCYDLSHFFKSISSAISKPK